MVTIRRIDRHRATLDAMDRPSPRVRREPPRFRRVAVRRVHRLGPRMVRLTFDGDLDGFGVPEPAASVRLLLPSPGARDLAMPTWDGNEFLLAGGVRPTIRTFTPRRVDPAARELDVDVVLHEVGAASDWAAVAGPGDPAAVSGPGRGYTIDVDAPAFLLAGDETAIPAISQLLETLPDTTPVQVHVEVARPDGRIALPEHPRAVVEWHDLPVGRSPGDAMLDAIRGADIGTDARVWAAGEAAAMQRIRRHLFDERDILRPNTSIRGYWKVGSRGSD